MKKLLSAILLLFTIACISQTKIPKTYTIAVHGRYDDTIKLTNEDGAANIPAPKLVDGSVCYNGECVLNDIKSIKIIKITYYEQQKQLPKYKITRVRVFNPWTGRYHWVNVITQPQLEQEQRQLEQREKDTIESKLSEKR